MRVTYNLDKFLGRVMFLGWVTWTGFLDGQLGRVTLYR